MQPEDASRSPAAPAPAPAGNDSTFAAERWQAPVFAASWISPPRPQRFFEDPTAPTRSDDHA